jgi:hypothetical protein
MLALILLLPRFHVRLPRLAASGASPTRPYSFRGKRELRHVNSPYSVRPEG